MASDLQNHPREFADARLQKPEKSHVRIVFGIVGGALNEFVGQLIAAGYDGIDLEYHLESFAKENALDLATADARFWDSCVDAAKQYQDEIKNNSAFKIEGRPVD